MQTRVSVQDAAQAKEVAHGQPRGVLGRRCRSTAMPPHPCALGEVRPDRGPRKGFLADPSWSNGRGVYGELQMPEDRADHLAVRDGGNDPQHPH